MIINILLIITDYAAQSFLDLMELTAYVGRGYIMISNLIVGWKGE